MKLSIIIPIYNEDKTIEEILKKILAVKIQNVIKEIIAVDDGSNEKTKLKIKTAIDFLKRQTKSDNIKVISHDKNLGKGEAVKTGVKSASGDFILIQDADLEYDPKYIPKLLEPILNHKAKVVFGTRLRRLPHLFQEEKSPLFLIHYFGNRFLSLLTSILYGQWITDMETGYKIFPRKFVESINFHARSFDIEPEITAKLMKKGYKILELPITTTPRGYSEGKKLNALKDGLKAFFALLKYRFTD